MRSGLIFIILFTVTLINDSSSITQFEKNLEHLKDNNFLKEIVNIIKKKQILNMTKS